MGCGTSLPADVTRAMKHLDPDTRKVVTKLLKRDERERICITASLRRNARVIDFVHAHTTFYAPLRPAHDGFTQYVDAIIYSDLPEARLFNARVVRQWAERFKIPWRQVLKSNMIACALARFIERDYGTFRGSEVKMELYISFDNTSQQPWVARFVFSNGETLRDATVNLSTIELPPAYNAIDAIPSPRARLSY